MFKTDFTIFYFANIELAVLCLFISFLFFGVLIYRQIYSVFDPAFFFFLLSASGYSVVFLLWMKDEISSYYFYNFLVSQILFYLGWNFFKPRWGNLSQVDSFIKIDLFSVVLFWVSLIFFFVIQLFVYKLQGLPIFMASRLDAFSAGGGIGTLDRFLFVSSIFCFTFSIFRILHTKKLRVIDISVVVFFLFTKLVSGSKLGVLDGVFLIGLVSIFVSRWSYFRNKEKRINKFLIFCIVFSFPAALIVTYIQQNVSSEESLGFLVLLLKLLLRFVNTGDIFYLSWVDNYVGRIPNDQAFFALFADSLGSLRLVPRSELPQHLGFAVMLEHTKTDNTIGPNARFNVFGLHYFGILGLYLYSLLLGCIVGFFRNKLLCLLPKNTTSLMLYVLLSYIVLFVEQDFNSMALKYLFNCFIFFILVFPLVYLISIFKRESNG
jgi:hypothetical protein